MDSNFEYQSNVPKGNSFGEILNNKSLADELREIFAYKRDPKAKAKLLFYLIGVVAGPLSLIGASYGYIKSYSRLWRNEGIKPRLHDLPTAFKAAIAIGIAIAWTVFLLIIAFIYITVGAKMVTLWAVLTYFMLNASSSLGVFIFFNRWRNSQTNLLMTANEQPSARYALPKDVIEYLDKPGLFIGGPYRLAHKTHIFTSASSRSGKTLTLLINALLGSNEDSGSWVVIDPKNEVACITARGMRMKGYRTVFLNPWDLLSNYVGEKSTYNPLDFVLSASNPDLLDDLDLIAELIVEIKPDAKDSFFADAARSMIAGLLLHIVCKAGEGERPNLTELYEMCRLAADDWDKLIADMLFNEHPIHQQALKLAASEMIKNAESPETNSNFFSNMQNATAFLKSKPMQDSLVSGFDPYDLAKDGKVIVYIALPVDRLSTAGGWLRLVTTTMMRAVVRKPGKRVTFLFDEAASLKFLREIPNALAAYAGFNIRLWLVYQDLSQIRSIYGNLWESVLGNTGIKQFFGTRSNFDCKYISEALGTKTNTLYKRDFFGMVTEVKNTRMPLCSPEDVRLLSKDNMFLFMGENYPALVKKMPYYDNPNLYLEDGIPLFDPTPYESASFKGTGLKPLDEFGGSE